MKKTIVTVLLFALLAAGTCGCGNSYAQNSFELPETRESVPEALSVYGGEDIGFSFLYPYGMNVSWNDEDGACISEKDGEIPYVLVSKTSKGGMTPENYFKSSDKQMLKEFDSVQSSQIHEVPLGDKTLYMTRYQCTSGNTDLVIDRYVEIYRSCYIQYTAVSSTAEEMNTALYYAAGTLSPENGKYFGEYTSQMNEYKQDDTGISIEIPEMLDVRELTIGYFAYCDDAILLSVICTEDGSGNPIYNRQNFIDCAAADPDFVAGYLGADSASFGSGEEVSINGRGFYAYPMTTKTSDEEFTGEIFLTNADENGCIVLCYAVKDGCPYFDELTALCRKSAGSFNY